MVLPYLYPIAVAAGVLLPLLGAVCGLGILSNQFDRQRGEPSIWQCLAEDDVI